MPETLTSHLVVPVATADDARTTAQVLEEYEFDRITVVHVIEKGDGSPDKLPLEKARTVANEAFEAFQEQIPSAETELVYGGDIVATITNTAAELEASAIAFYPRGGSRVVQFLTGDTALKLVTESDRPVIALPGGETNAE